MPAAFNDDNRLRLRLRRRRDEPPGSRVARLTEPPTARARSRARPGARARRLRARLPLAIIAGLLASLVLSPAALANFITPKAGGSPNADSIASLYKIILYIAAIVFVVVEGALVYSVYKFRAKKGAVAAQIHGNTRLEIGWTVAAALILVVLTVVTFAKLPGIVNPPNSDADGLVLSAALDRPTPPNGRELTVCVQGRQYIWRYTYGAGCLNAAFSDKLPYSYEEMVVPEHTTVVLKIQSSDVIHSWWIPSLGGKVDAVPGYTTYTWFKVPHTGLFHGQCAQLCGTNHAAMTARVKVLTPDEYAAWVQHQTSYLNSANAQVSRLRQILTANGNL